MSDMVRAWLDHTQQLDQAATEGPWVTDPFIWKPGRGLPDSKWIGIDTELGYVAQIEAGGDWNEDHDAEWIAHARTALPKATAAIRAVLDLHQPYRYRDSERDLCAECISDSESEGTIEWPCPTVQVITGAIDGDRP